MWPFYSHLRIIPLYSAFILGMVEVGTLICENSLVREYKKSMSKSRRNIKLILKLPRKNNAIPFTKRWRSMTKIDGYIENLALNYPYQLSLRVFF